MTCCDWHRAKGSQGLAWSHTATPKPTFGQLSIHQLEAPTVPGRHFSPMTCTWAASAEGLPKWLFLLPSSLECLLLPFRMMFPPWVDPSSCLGLFSHQQDGQLGHRAAGRC